MVSGSLLSGGRERNWIVFIVPFEVTIPCERPSYPHIPAVNHEDGGKPKKGRVRKGNASKIMEAQQGKFQSLGVRLQSRKDPESMIREELGVQNLRSR